MIDGPRFTAADFRARDWRLLSEVIPRMEDGNELEQALKWYAWGSGWIRRDGLPDGKSGREYLRRVWRGLAGGPYQAGPFRVERSGRWGISFVLDPAYAEQRKVRRRRRGHSTAIDHIGRGRGDWDATFRRLHEAETERCFEVGQQRAVSDPDSAEWEYLNDGDTQVRQAAECRPEASVESGPLNLDTPVCPEDVGILEDQFRAFIPGWRLEPGRTEGRGGSLTMAEVKR